MIASTARLAICLSALIAFPALGQAIRISTTDVNLGLPGRPLGEPDVAAHPNLAGHLLGAAMVHDPAAHLSDSTRAKVLCAAFVSVDGGITWQTHLFDIAGCFDPWVAITPDGDAVFTALGRDPRLSGQSDALVVYHSPDGGLHWDSQPVSLGPGHDHPMTVVDRSDLKRANWLYVVSSLGAQADSGLLRFGLSVSRSRNGGRTFDPPVFLRPTTLMALAETPTVLSDGTLVISYVEPALSDGRTRLPRRRAWLLQSHDGGFDFSRPAFVNDACGSSTTSFSLSALAADPSPGPSRDRMYFACNRANPSTVVVGWSSDLGASWATVKSVRDTIDTLSRSQVMGMAVDARGVLGVAWLESGHNPAGNCAADVYFGASVDGGRTFLPPERVARAPSCADRILNGQAWAGDYFGLVVDSRNRFRLLWSGVRDGVFQLHLSTIVVASSARTPN